jgi:hypothetical protein
MNQPQALKTVALVSVTAAATLLLIQACGGGDAFAQAAPDPMEGVWQIAVTGQDCTTGAPNSAPPFISSQVFQHGGTFVDTSSHTPTLRGPGFGAWSRGGDTYNQKMQFFRYNPDGTVAGFAIASVQATMSADGQSFTSTRRTQNVDMTGNVVATICSNAKATRFG